MSAAIAEPVVQRPKPLTLVPPSIASKPQEASADRYPLLPVFVAGGIAMAGALVFVGSILMWLALRHTGINATW
jgi:hypothetical protein